MAPAGQRLPGSRGPDERPALRLDGQASALAARSGSDAVRDLAAVAGRWEARVNAPAHSLLSTPLTAEPAWYKDAIIYQLHVKSFYDSNNDGVGDFPGLISRLDYIA